MDIVVTTPKHLAAQAEQEAADVIEWGGGLYFRNLGARQPKNIQVGDRCFYVEHGAVRGFAEIVAITDEPAGVSCDTSGKRYARGWYVFMDAESWQWIEPIEMNGFQGWRYFRDGDSVKVIGGWLDPKPW